MNYFAQMVDSLDEQIWRYTVRLVFHLWCFIIYDIVIVGVALALLISWGSPLWAIFVQSGLGFLMTYWNWKHIYLYYGARDAAMRAREIAWRQLQPGTRS